MNVEIQKQSKYTVGELEIERNLTKDKWTIWGLDTVKIFNTLTEAKTYLRNNGINDPLVPKKSEVEENIETHADMTETIDEDEVSHEVEQTFFTRMLAIRELSHRDYRCTGYIRCKEGSTKLVFRRLLKEKLEVV